MENRWTKCWSITICKFCIKYSAILYDTCSLCRILKQALRGSGSNLTISHMTTMSMCGLSLLQMAKKADLEFQTPYRSSHHTVRDAQKDIANMTCFLIEEKVARNQERRGCEFTNPLTLGAKKNWEWLH